MSPSRLLAVIFIFGCTCVGVADPGELDRAPQWRGRSAPGPRGGAALGGEARAAPTGGVGRAAGHESRERPGEDGGRDDIDPEGHTEGDQDEPAAPRLDPHRGRVRAGPRDARGSSGTRPGGAKYQARYRVHNPDDVPRTLGLRGPFPSSEAIYEGFRIRFDGRDLSFQGDLAKDASARVSLPARAEGEIEVAYRTRGLGPWTYSFGTAGVSRIHDFELTMKTDFKTWTFRRGTLSPTTLETEGAGRQLTWTFESLVTGQKIGLEPPVRLNPGPCRRPG